MTIRVQPSSQDLGGVVRSRRRRHAHRALPDPRPFAQRCDAGIIAVLTATGIRAGELAGIRYDAGDPRRSDVDLWRREITVRGKDGRARVVRIGHEATRALDRYLRIGPGMDRRGGRSCGWGRATAGR